MPDLLKLARAILPALVCTGAFAAESELLPPDEPVAQRSQRDWSIQWWKWAASFDQEDSPVADRTGARCAAGQKGAVWFLAGTYGTRRTIRSCTVPAGKYLFFPLINYVVMPGVGSSSTCPEVRASAARRTDPVSALVLEIDGKRYEGLERHRQASVACFNLGPGNGLSAVPDPAASNGYYVMLRPLARGTHVIHFGGALPSMLQAVTYTLKVE